MIKAKIPVEIYKSLEYLHAKMIQIFLHFKKFLAHVNFKTPHRIHFLVFNGLLFQILAVDDLQKMEMRLMLKFGTDSIISIIACTSIMLTILLISVHLYALVKNISFFIKKGTSPVY